jgi:hypothetical protein
MAVGEVQQADIAEWRELVQPLTGRGVGGQRAGRVNCQTRRRCER